MPASQREFRVFFGLLLVLFGFINGADAAESSSLMHRINIFAVDGHDPRVKQSRSGDGAAFAPIVGIESPKLTLQADPRFVEGKRRSSATTLLCAYKFSRSFWYNWSGQHGRSPVIVFHN
jgi:hypothetical protein